MNSGMLNVDDSLQKVKPFGSLLFTNKYCDVVTRLGIAD